MISERQKAAVRLAPVVAMALTFVILAAPAQGSDEVTNAEAGQTFREAFRPGMKLQQRVNKLESVLLEYDRNKWTDDAEWAMAEFAMRNGYLEQAARLHERVLRRKQLPCLQAFTRTTHLYRTSRVRFEQWILEQTGHRYARRKKSIKAIPYNVLPMSLSGQLGYIYERMGRNRRAIHCYRTALSMCPPRTLLQRIYGQRVRSLEERLRKENPGLQDQKNPEQPVPEWQRMLRDWDKKQAEKSQKESRKKQGPSPLEQEKYEALEKLLDRQKKQQEEQQKAESDEQS